MRDLPPDVVLDVARSTNRFTIAILRARTDENAFLSPLSVATALGMTLAGAAGSTAQQLRDVLGGTDGDATLHSGLAGISSAIEAASGGGTAECPTWSFNGGNAAFVDTRLDILDSYVATLTDPYGAPPEAIDFRDTQAAAETINNWARAETEGTIDNVADPSQFDDHTLLVLANALHFEGFWETPFPGDATAPGTFTHADGTCDTVDFMDGTASFAWSEAEDAWVVELPYRGGDLDMLLVVPFANDGLDRVLDALDPETLTHEALNDPAEIQVLMPSFEVRSDASLVLPLMMLGVVDLFDKRAADLSGIGDPPPGFENLYVDDVIHDAWIRVDEAGTEASAVTTVEIDGSDTAEPIPTRIAADRPFAYFIRDRVTGAILFAGRMDAPEQAGLQEQKGT